VSENHQCYQSNIVYDILTRYIKGVCPTKTTPTIALEFCTKHINVSDGSKIKVQLWDTAGQEKYKSIVSQYYNIHKLQIEIIEKHWELYWFLT